VLAQSPPRRALGRVETVLLVAVAVALALVVALWQGESENPYGNMGYAHVV